jgi:molybdopterin-biosynthesis enzyme MoeA-like protein
VSIGILVIGDEILSGRREDKHLTHCIHALGERGLRLGWARFIGDDAAALTNEFRVVRAGGDIGFIFGGIGATPDDLTRQCVATAHDVPLTRHPEAQALIEARFGDDAHPNRILMADLPHGATLIPNPINRIPGFSLGRMHCLPGFPHMAWPMLDWVLDTHYRNLPRDKPTELSVVVHNVPESVLVPWMQEFTRRHPELKLFSLPRYTEKGEPEIELGVSGESSAVPPALQEIKQMLDAQQYRYSEPQENR